MFTKEYPLILYMSISETQKITSSMKKTLCVCINYNRSPRLISLHFFRDTEKNKEKKERSQMNFCVTCFMYFPITMT